MSIADSAVGLTKDDEDFYPSGDDEPIAETFLHVRVIMLLFQAIEDFLATKEDTFVSASMFWYWQKGNVGTRWAPDIMVVKGVGKMDRQSFRSWDENGAIPCSLLK